ncbi:MAG: MarR family transcriptional regulator [Pseudomonadota bacterium]
MDEKHLSISREAATSCLAFGVRKTARAITQTYDRKLASIGLTGTQFSMLNAINLVGEPSMMQLAEILSTDRTTLTRNLNPLKKQQLIEIRSGHDKRMRQIQLTQGGEEILSQALEQWKSVNDTLSAAFGRGKSENLLRDLGKLMSVLSQC